MPAIFITGCNRGIGLALTKAYAEQGYKTIGGCRDPSKMEKVPGVVVVKYDAETPTGGQEAIGAIKAAGITSLDVLCVNAAVVLSHAHFKELDYDTAIRMHKVNVLGPMVLFQAALPMLHAGAKVCLVSSGAGTMSNKTHRAGGGVYGMSKASLNFMMCKMAVEHPDLVVFSLSPGWLRTDMGNDGARANGMDQAPLEVSETLPGIMKVIETATRDNYGGFMINHDGSKMDF